jgi:SNF2 family DNA or RNA helicase
MPLEPLTTRKKLRASSSAPPWVPRDYQKVAVSWLIKHPEAALFLDPGLGKTSAALAAFKLLRKAQGARKCLIIAPKRVCYLVWTHDEGGELAKWADFHDLKVKLLHGPDKEDRVVEDADVYVINPDGMKWLIDSKHIDKLIKKGVDLLIVDELSAFKHANTKRFKQIKPHLGRFRRRWGLTGSPASNGLIDLFGQVYMLDLGQRLGRYITHFRHKYFLPTGFKGYVWKPQEGAEDAIYKAISDLALSMKAEDHLDLPDLVEQNIWVELPKKVRQVYDALEEDLIALLEKETVTAANAAVASGKCRQVASGGVYSDVEFDPKAEVPVMKRRKINHLHDEKTEALVELVDELQGSPLLVGYEFDHDLERIRKALGNIPAINGKTSGKETNKLAAAWNRGELPVLAGHPMAMGHGLNLQASGNHICWYSLTWNYELYDQFNRRVYRQGQTKRVIVHRILARGTLDETVAQVLSSKERGQNALFQALKKIKRRK